MITIVSNKSDASTNSVIDWLSFLGKDVVRLNGEDFLGEVNTFKITISDNETNVFTQLPHNDIDFNKISAIWFRRDSYIHFKEEIKETFEHILEPDLYNSLSSGINQELLTTKKAAYDLIFNRKIKSLGNYKNHAPNKIDILRLAKKNKISIPNTIITNNRVELINFYNSCNGQLITKAIRDGVDFIVNKKEHYSQYTESVDQQTIDNCSDSFSASLFQEKVNKEYEIRTFFIKGKCYSMAIFSQLDSETSVDFRRYNKERGNRNIPFKLPKDLEEKITLLMNDAELDTGSLDFIKAKDGRYVFLEINPVGQYGMTSSPCNYNLDKIIAQHLI